MNTENYISSGIIEQYVLGLCSSEEMNEVEALRKTDATFNDAIISFEKEFEQKILNTTSMPSVEVDTQILQKLRSLSNPLEAVKQEQKVVKVFNLSKLVAAASIALLAVSAFFNFSLFSKTKEQEKAIESIAKNKSITLPEGDYSVLKNPSITPVSMYGVGTHSICRCTMFWDKSTGKAYVMIHHLVQSSEGKDYQLWATVNGKQVSVGIINDKIRDRFVEVTGVPNDANAFVVTLENDGGAAQPSKGEEWLAGKI